MKRCASPSLDPEIVRRARRRAEEAQATRAADVGTVLRTDAHGEWRTVPRVPGVEVSSEGWLRLLYYSRKGTAWWSHPHLPGIDGYGYRRFTHNHKKHSAHWCVCRAFHGKPADGDTPDHIAKYDNDPHRERQDNRASNLKWATLSEQACNRKLAQKPAIGRPVILRKVGEPDQWFYCRAAAANALGLMFATQITRMVSSGKPRFGYTAIPAPVEVQSDLDGEVWKTVSPSMRVSTMGRVQVATGGAFGDRFTPKPWNGELYAVVRKQYFHVLVLTTFGPPRPTPGHTVDHHDRDTKNNKLSNLSWATQQQQNRNQGARRERTPRMLPVEVLWPRAQTWVRYPSRGNACKSIKLEHGVHLDQARLGKCLEAGKPYKGYRFRICD